MIRNSEIKKFYNNFIKQWEIVYSAYYDRTGKVLGAPLVIKDSNNKYFEYSDYVGMDRQFVSDSDLIFRDPRRFKITDPTSVSDSNGWIGNLLVATGIEIPEINRGYPNIYDLSASEVGKTTIIVTFGSDPVAEGESSTVSQYATGVDSNGNPINEGNVVTDSPADRTFNGLDNEKGNFMLIMNLPYDIAAQIDKIIDGKADGQKGNFVCVKKYTQPLSIDITITQSDAIDPNVDGLSSSLDCGGPFGWGGYVDGDNKYYYVTALYKLGI